MTKDKTVETQFETAVLTVWKEGKASTSLIQRALSIGYNKAAKLVERMEEIGVVSPANHVGKRDVFSTKAMLHTLGERGYETSDLQSMDGLPLIRAINAIVIREEALENAAESSLTKMETEARKGRPPMKDDPDFKKHNTETYRITAAELRSFIERAERLIEEKSGIMDQIKEVMAEAKARGYDVKVIKKLIALRKRHADDIAEEQAVLEMYKEALGM